MGRHFKRGGPVALLTATALALAGCATTSGTEAPAASAQTASGTEPYASTYKAYPGVPTAIVGATVLMARAE